MKKATDAKSKRTQLIFWATLVIISSILAKAFPNAIVETAATIIALYALYKTVGVPKSYYRRVERRKKEREEYKQQQEN